MPDGERRLRELLSVTPPDALYAKAGTFLALGEILRRAGHVDEAAEALSTAVKLYERKGNVAAVRNARPQLLGATQ